MRIVLTLLVRNEIDIIRTHLDYHLSLDIDHIIITDNLSDDGTEVVLREYASRERITLLEEHDDTYDQSIWVTKMAHIAQSVLKADWVIHGDCDEFFVTYQGRSLRSLLGGFSATIDFLNIDRFDFVPLRDEEQWSPELMKYKKAVSTNIFGNRLPPKIIHRNIPRVVVDQGNHNISFPTNLISLDCQEIVIYHYPVRSFQQFESKIRLGGRAYNNNVVLHENVGSTWRYLYEIYKKGELREAYNALSVEISEISQKVESGELIEDNILMDKLRELL